MSSQQQTSSLWQHVAELRPRLRKHVRIIVQDYRGERWYILHDESADRFSRFNGTAFEVIGRLTGDLTIQEILNLVNTERDPEEAIEANDMLNILAQLHHSEVLRGGLPVSVQEVLKRYSQSQNITKRGLSNPLAMRIPLFDPNHLLDHLAPVARLCFSVKGLWLWLSVMFVALILLVVNWPELIAGVAAKTFSSTELLSFWLLYPIIKILHEIGHGMAVKAGGGEAHETGVTLLLFMPVPYINASASIAFRDKRRRALVAAAGILVELFLSAIGLFVWLLTEPGIVHDSALNIMLISGVSTLLFNGNPLIRFDGYYLLEDLLEIPNLATRASRFYLYLIHKYVLRLKDAHSPVTADGEAIWFLLYGFASPIYRLTVVISIALYLSSKFLIVGVILACWTLFMRIIKPLLLTLRFLAINPRIEAHRLRVSIIFISVIMVCIGLLSIPIPLIKNAQGVIWVDNKGQLFSPSSSFVKKVVKTSGSDVKSGDLLIQLEDKTLITRQKMLKARLNELHTEQLFKRKDSRVLAAMVADDIKAVTAQLTQVTKQIEDLQIVSPVSGRFILADPYQLRGKFVHQGEVLGYVMQDKQPVVRAVVTQDCAGLLNSQLDSIEVMLADQMGTPIQATLLREVPAGSTKLPSITLGALGGGYISVDTRDETGLTATEKVFQLDLALPEGTKITGIGERAYVRVNHGYETIWGQWKRSMQQLLLRRLSYTPDL